MKPTAEMKKLAKEVIEAKQKEKAIRLIVECYQIESIRTNNFTNQFNGERVTELRYTYTMSDDQFDVYQADCKRSMEANGLKVKAEGNCPLLEAEEVTRKAVAELLETCESISQGMTYEKAVIHGKVEEFLDINMQFIHSKTWKSEI